MCELAAWARMEEREGLHVPAQALPRLAQPPALSLQSWHLAQVGTVLSTSWQGCLLVQPAGWGHSGLHSLA